MSVDLVFLILLCSVIFSVLTGLIALEERKMLLPAKISWSILGSVLLWLGIAKQNVPEVVITKNVNIVNNLAIVNDYPEIVNLNKLFKRNFTCDDTVEIVTRPTSSYGIKFGNTIRLPK